MLGGPCHEAAWQMMNLVFFDCHDVDKSFIRELRQFCTWCHISKFPSIIK
jgi:hypothetical protein